MSPYAPLWDRLRALDRKLLRDLWHIKGQALAIAVVIGCGVGMWVMSKGMLTSLDETRRAYYERQRFADVYASVKRAPESMLPALERVPGVRRAESRIRAAVILDVAGAGAPISGMINSLPERQQPVLNDILLTRGRYFAPDRPDEVLLLDSFATAHRLVPGDTISATLNGTRRTLHIVGLAMSPEFVYAIAPGEIVPDNKRFGVLWMNRRALGNAFDLDGAFNEALLLLARGASEKAVIARLDQLLDRYGAIGAYGRDQQLSDQFLSNEIAQLETMGLLLPPIFLLVAAFLLNVVLSRLIDMEREQIGLLKAFGYTDGAVALHYLKLVGLICALGIFFGYLLGFWLGRGMALMYIEYFKFPFLLFRASPQVYLVGGGISLLAALAGTATAVLRVARLKPAVAMTAPPPPDYSRSARWIDRLSAWIDQPTRMIIRHVYRWPLRSALTTTGIAMAMGLLIGSSFSLDAVLYMVNYSFNVVNRHDVSVSFVEPRSRPALHAMAHAPGVMRTEPYRAVSAIFHHGHRSRRQAVIGIRADADLSRLIDTAGKPVTLPDTGIVLSDKLAQLLGAERGDNVRLQITEGRRGSFEVPVAAIVRTYLGTTAYMELSALNRLMREGPVISGAYLLADENHVDRLYRRLKQMPVVAGIGLQEEAQRVFYATLQESLGTFVFFNTLFSGLIVIGVVYNSARISLSERARELASLRVLGLTRGEVSYILLGQLALLTALALPFGAGLGYLLAAFLVQSMNTELFRVPLVIAPHTYGYAVLVVVTAALGSALLVRRRIDRLDLVSVLKTRE